MSPLPVPGRSRAFEARWARCRRHEGIGGPKRYQWYIASSEGWRCRRALMRERAGQRCQVCGATGSLEVHHNTYARLGFEEPQDLVVLCARCHATYHRELDPRLPAAGPGTAAAPPPARRRRRWPWLPLLAAGTVAGVALGLPGDWRERLPDPPAIAMPAAEPARTPTAAPVRTRPASAPTATVTAFPARAGNATRTSPPECDPAYPTVCLPPAPPRLTCAATDARNFPALPPDPHGLDSDRDGVACEPLASP